MDWQLWVSPAVGIAALLFAIYVYLQNRRPKRLSHETRINQEIVSQSRYSQWPDLSVRFGDRELKHPRVVVVRVTNTGRVEARSDDFEEPLAVSATKGAEIVAATIEIQKRDGESQEIEPARLNAAEVVAPKMLINEGEWVEFRLLVESEEWTSVHLRGRAAGFSLSSYTPRRRRSFRPSLPEITALLGLLLALASAAYGFYALRQDRQVDRSLSLPEASIPVPNLVGKQLEPAVTQINGSDLKLGTVNRVRSSSRAGRVLSQSPAARDKVYAGTEITLVVSDGP